MKETAARKATPELAEGAEVRFGKGVARSTTGSSRVF